MRRNGPRGPAALPIQEPWFEPGRASPRRRTQPRLSCYWASAGFGSATSRETSWNSTVISSFVPIAPIGIARCSPRSRGLSPSVYPLRELEPSSRSNYSAGAAAVGTRGHAASRPRGQSPLRVRSSSSRSSAMCRISCNRSACFSSSVVMRQVPSCGLLCQK